MIAFREFLLIVKHNLELDRKGFSVCRGIECDDCPIHNGFNCKLFDIILGDNPTVKSLIKKFPTLILEENKE